MKYGTRIILLCLLLSLSGCGKVKKPFVLDKEGTKYEVNEQVSFYYPNAYAPQKTMSQSELVENNSITVFENGEERMFYAMVNDSTLNTREEKEVLYQATLQQFESTQIEPTQIELDSGITVTQITGVSKEDEHFITFVFFDKSATHIYGYYATEDHYNENINYIKEFLYSLSISGTIQ